MDEASPSAKPTAQGTLATRPLSHLLLYLRTQRLTGKLMLRAEDGTGGAIAVWRGRIAAARTEPPVAFFGSVASAMGFVDASVAEAARGEAVARRVLHGVRLIERGDLTAQQRDAALAEQTARKVHHLLALPSSAAFSFYVEEPGAIEPPLALDPVDPLWRAIREGRPSDDEIRAVLAPFLGSMLRVVNEAPLTRAGLAAAERAICEALVARPMTVAQLQAAFAETAPELVHRIVYLLLLTKSAEPVSASSEAPPPGGSWRAGAMDEEAIFAALKNSRRPPPLTAPPPAAATSSAPPRNSAAPAYPTPPPAAPKKPSNAPVRRVSGSFGAAVTSTTPSAAPVAATLGPSDLGVAGITRRAETVEDEDPFDTLGVPRDAPVDAARAAYFRLVKVWHPDRLPAGLGAAAGAAGKIFTQMTRAHHTLTDTEARRAFLEARAARAVVPPRPRSASIRLIDMALSRKDFGFAGEEAGKLAAADPEDSEAHALAAWIAFSGGEGPDSAVRPALAALDRLVKGDSQCWRAHFYRGMIHKRLGDVAAAHRDFVRVTHLEPHHVEATREVRIYEMRRKK